MHDMTVGCCNERSCWTMPFEFVRMRYFYGQRLGVMELSDQAAYHAGKHAFHNARLHGFGVLCGLAAERYVFVPATTTTVLRVIRGAALDACGREVIIGADQCIDVAAWYAKNRGRSEVAAWAAAGGGQLLVALRYRDCPSDPAPAPRDPCGCDQAGCEFGRVREGFELSLLLPSERDKLLLAGTPSRAELAEALAGGSLEQLNDRIASLVARACPAPSDAERWLALATLTIALDAGAIANISAVDNAPSERLSLLPTQALQAVLLQAAVNAGTLGMGPGYGALTFEAISATEGTLALAIELATSGDPPIADALVAATFDITFVTLHRLDASGWTDVTNSVQLDTSSPPRITLKVTAADSTKPYRLTVSSPAATPIADTRGRAIAPAIHARTFGFKLDGTTLTLA
jgi:hypothetical protein